MTTSPNNETMPHTQDVAEARATLATLANELLDFSKTFEPRQEQIFGIEPEIIQKARAFIAAAQSPMDFVMATSNTVIGASVIRTLVHLKALQAIPYPDGATADMIATTTGAQASLIERLLREAVCAGFLCYDPQRSSFKHTRFSAPWTQPQNLTSDSFAFIYDSGLAPMVQLPHWLKHNDPNYASEPTGSKAGTHNPLTYCNGTEGKSLFETIAQQPENLAVFGRVLEAVKVFRPFTGIYPWERLADADPERPLFVDIGGGHGPAIAAILAAHPDLPASGFVLQDLEKVVTAAEPLLPTGVQCQAHDFFTPNPVKGAKAYHIRACLHDWPDDMCVQMLKCVVSAMASDSRLLIAESLMPSNPHDDEGGLVGFQDMIMLCIGGKERTKEGFAKIAGEAGLVVEKIWEGDGSGRFAIVECKLAE